MADIPGAALLVVTPCALKIHVKAVVVVGIVGLASQVFFCIIL